MPLHLDELRRERLVAGLRGFYLTEFDQEVSVFQAEQVLEFFLSALGPQVYNQAVQDARAYFQRTLDDLDGEVYEPEPS